MMHWFHWLLAASILGFVVWNRRTEWRREVVWGGVLIVAMSCLAAVAAWPGLLNVQKTLTALAMPCGLIWLLLLGAALRVWQRRQTGWWYLLLLLLFTLAGNNTVAAALINWLQEPFATIDPMAEDGFDAVVVLGGGTSTRPSGYTQLNTSGDRVMLAARLYLAGKTATLVATGEQGKWAPAYALGPAEETRVLWANLRVPTEAVVLISGRNTREEMLSLAALLEERPWQRVGLITSAWHLRRAMRLARFRELALQPLPADFRGDDDILRDFSLIPSAGAMCDIQLGMKELLAMAVGR